LKGARPRTAGAADAHQPRKRFGQNFLVDPHYIQRIVNAVSPAPGDRIVEIGPGQGALTAPLIARAGHVTAIEIDRDLAARLQAAWTPEQLTLHVVDALEFDVSTLGNGLRIVGNLPYNISSPLLFHLACHDETIIDLHVMLQKEVVARMTAAPGTPDYGRLSVMLQVKFAVTRLFTVPPGAFRPVPAVDSAVARLTPLRAAKPVLADEALFARVVAAAFGQRRKTLRQALAGFFGSAAEAETACIAAGIDPAARGEKLQLPDFVRLAAHSN